MEGGGGFAVLDVDQIGAFAKEAVDLGQVSVLDGFEEGLFHAASLAIFGFGLRRVHGVTRFTLFSTREGGWEAIYAARFGYGLPF